MDRIDKARRSWNMSRIRSSDTVPERLVRSYLHRLGARFRTNTGRTLPGKPDVVLPAHRTAIFVHGCFWHRHPGCLYAYTPKSRIQFWKDKFERNMLRDTVVRKALQRAGWRVVVVWECETRIAEKLETRLARLVKTPRGGQSKLPAPRRKL